MRGWRRALRLAALLSFAGATGCGAEADQASNAESIGTTRQAVSWSISTALLHEHHLWHNGGRSRTETGKDFLIFHRQYLAKMAREFRAASENPGHMVPWIAVPAELKQSRYGWNTSLQNAETRLATNNPPFATENDFGTFAEGQLHGFLHGASAAHFGEPDLANFDSPRSTVFFQIHGLIDYWWSRYLGRRMLHIAISGNINGHWTELNHALLNNRPFARILITQNYASRLSGPYTNAHTGIWYNGGTGRWAIFNEGFQAMPPGSLFNVQIEGGQFSSTAYSQNTTPDDMYMMLPHPGLNGLPFGTASVTHNWSALEAPNVYSNHAFGVVFVGFGWALFNQDGATMQSSSWNVLEGAPKNDTGPSNQFSHVATSSNTSGHATTLSHPALNGNGMARIIVTPNFNPGGVGGVGNIHPIGVRYTGSQWEIFNQDLGAMPLGTGFNVVIP